MEVCPALGTSSSATTIITFVSSHKVAWGQSFGKYLHKSNALKVGDSFISGTFVHLFAVPFNRTPGTHLTSSSLFTDV